MRTIIFKALAYCQLMLLAASCHNQNSTYNILDYGAKGDGKTMNTKAINNAVEKCNSKGGGTVLIPSGKFVTGTVVLLSNVNLQLEPGAVLLGSIDTTDYLIMNDALFNEGYNRYGMIYAVDATNVSITGSGEINGNGTFFMYGLDKPKMSESENDYDRKFIRQGYEFMKPGNIF